MAEGGATGGRRTPLRWEASATVMGIQSSRDGEEVVEGDPPRECDMRES